MAIKTASNRRAEAASAISSQSVVINTGTGLSTYSFSGGTNAVGGTSGVTISGVTYTQSDYSTPSGVNYVAPGGGYIKIAGSGFTASSVVTLNGTAISNTYVSSSQINVPLTSHAAGVVNLVVFTGNAGYSSLVTYYAAPYSIQYLAVGAGGSGGTYAGGGGGAGGVLTGTAAITIGTSYTIAIGGGGVAVSSPGSIIAGNQGGNTYITGGTLGNIVAVGGGAGGSTGGLGGSGGGGGGGGPGPTVGGSATNYPGPTQQGYPGGQGGTDNATYRYSGGGGGAGAAGAPGTSSGSGVGGPGGAGYTWAYTGNVYAGGGGGSGYSGSSGAGGTGGGGSGGTYTATGGGAGNVNTGSGGGGTYLGYPSGTGGSGTVIFAVPTPSYPGPAPGAVVTTPPAAPGMTVLTWTTSGTYTA